MKITKQSFAQIAFEFLSIVFAVLLALGLNSYKQNMDLESEGEYLRNKILKECQRNLVELDSVLISNEAFFDVLDSMRNIDKQTITHFKLNISSELLTRSAWDFTKSSRSFSFMDEDFLSEAAIVYEAQDYYMFISNQMFDKLGDLLLSDPDLEKAIMISHYYLNNLNETAKSLKENYIEFLADYDPVSKTKND